MGFPPALFVRKAAREFFARVQVSMEVRSVTDIRTPRGQSQPFNRGFKPGGYPCETIYCVLNSTDMQMPKSASHTYRSASVGVEANYGLDHCVAARATL